MPRIDLQGKPIVITGASSGIGAATAIACARAGMPVALGARRVDQLNAVAEKVRAVGGRVIVLSVDVTSPKDCEALIEACAAEFGSVYSVFANAGYGEESRLHEFPDNRIRAMFETNFYGSLNIIRPALHRMLASPLASGGYRGHVLWCSSCLARLSLPRYSIYSATKAAQALCAQSMRHELKAEGVYVSSVHPIGTKTEFSDQVRARSGGERKTVQTPASLKQSADFVADRIVRCLQHPKPEVWTGLKGHAVGVAMGLGLAFPRVGDWVLGRMARRR